MNSIQVLSAPWAERLGWTLVHFLWQGTLMAALYAIARRWATPSRNAQIRYALACIALAAMVAAPLATYSLSDIPAVSSNAALTAKLLADVPLAPSPARLAPVSPAPLPNLAARVWRDDFMPWLVMAWFTGAIIFWVRLMGGWMVAARMRSMLVRPAPLEWQRALDEIKARVCVSGPVKLLVSALVQVPTVVGWLRPVVLVPVGALAGLPPEHVEALLAHELAHIRRHDYLINILQSVAEALLFYHPAVWWVSNHIRHEREMCCDDVAVGISGDALTYVHALARLEQCRPAHFSPALAASGGSLAERIGRLLGQPAPNSGSLPGSGVIAAAALILVAAYGLFGQASSERPKFEVASVKLSAPYAPGIPRSVSMRGGPGSNDPHHAIFENFPLAGLIMNAYNVRLDQLSGPAWLVSNFGPSGVKVDIIANVPEGATKEQFLMMLQDLLADRFKLTLHHDKKEMQVYELVVAKNGPKLTPSPAAPTQEADTQSTSLPTGVALKLTASPDGYPVLEPGPGMALIGNRGRMRATHKTMEKFAEWLSVQSGRTVTDKTGLKGEFDFGLFWMSGESNPSDLNAGPTLAEAVQDQLGLRLESKKGQSDVIVIDHVEKTPTEN